MKYNFYDLNMNHIIEKVDIKIPDKLEFNNIITKFEEKLYVDLTFKNDFVGFIEITGELEVPIPRRIWRKKYIKSPDRKVLIMNFIKKAYKSILKKLRIANQNEFYYEINLMKDEFNEKFNSLENMMKEMDERIDKLKNN